MATPRDYYMILQEKHHMAGKLMWLLYIKTNSKLQIIKDTKQTFAEGNSQVSSS